MAHTLLHMNGFDLGGNTSYDYTGAERSNETIGYSYDDWSMLPAYNSGRFLLIQETNRFIQPALPGAPFTTLCVSAHFCFYHYTLGRDSSDTIFMRFIDSVSSSTQVEIRAEMNPGTGMINLCAYRGSTLLEKAMNAIYGGIKNWVWISVLVHVDGSNGKVRIVVGPSNQEVMNFTGNTQNTVNQRIDAARLGTLGGTNPSWLHIDNLFITSASSTDAPLNERRIRTVVPTGNDSVQWTPSGATQNWQAVSEIPPNLDSSYNSSNTSGAQDTFATNWQMTSNIIHAVQVVALARKDDAGAQNIRNVIKIGTTSYPGQSRALIDSYFRARNIWEQNPATSSDWQQSDFNSGMTFGYRVA